MELQGHHVCRDIALLSVSSVGRTVCTFVYALDLIYSGGFPSGNCDSPHKMGSAQVFLFA